MILRIGEIVSASSAVRLIKMMCNQISNLKSQRGSNENKGLN